MCNNNNNNHMLLVAGRSLRPIRAVAEFVRVRGSVDGDCTTFRQCAPRIGRRTRETRRNVVEARTHSQESE